MAKEKEYIIIGWGLAGATLAWQFHKAGIPCTVYDKGENVSSRISAGMVNPIVFRSMNKGWLVDELLPYAKEFYGEIEEILSVQLLSRKSITKVFASIEEQNSWATREADERFNTYLNPVEELEVEGVDAPHGVGKVNSIGHLDVNLFLDASKTYLSEQSVTFKNRGFSLKMIDRDEYIFCTGIGMLKNLFFRHLPLRATYGDVLIIKAPHLNYQDILNKNMFILPLGNDRYKVGSTYYWGITDPTPLEKGKLDLIERLRSFCSFEFEVEEHLAGIRPTVTDRRPLLGTHPIKRNLHTFNGLGTKGVSIAPLMSKRMFEYLFHDRPLEKEVDIQRFEKHFEPINR